MLTELIGCFLIWTGEPSRRAAQKLTQRAAALFTRPQPPTYEVLPPLPAYACLPLPAHVLVRQRPIDGHALDLVRPYVRAHEGHAAAVGAAFGACA